MELSGIWRNWNICPDFLLGLCNKCACHWGAWGRGIGLCSDVVLCSCGPPLLIPCFLSKLLKNNTELPFAVMSALFIVVLITLVPPACCVTSGNQQNCKKGWTSAACGCHSPMWFGLKKQQKNLCVVLR